MKFTNPIKSCRALDSKHRTQQDAMVVAAPAKLIARLLLIESATVRSCLGSKHTGHREEHVSKLTAFVCTCSAQTCYYRTTFVAQPVLVSHVLSFQMPAT